MTSDLMPDPAVDGQGYPTDRVYADFVPASDYVSPDFLQQEKEKVWPAVWLMACRAEQIANPGDFHIFEVIGESILVVRQDDGGLKAFYNVCPHRGRLLKEAGDPASRAIYCRFHGWRWGIDGGLQRVVNPSDWAGCAAFGPGALDLAELRVGSWGGWVFVTMNDEAPSLDDYLGAVPEHIDCFDISAMRVAWSASVVTPANWKLVLNAFNEGYHVEATHPQTVKYGSVMSPSVAHGIHSQFYISFDEEELPNRPTAMAALKKDPRELTVKHFEEMLETLGAMYLEPGLEAARRVVRDVPAGSDFMEIQAKQFEFHKQELESRGVTLPAEMTPAALGKAGFGWHIFPNFIILPTLDGALCYRTRPNGDDPDSCIWDVWSLARFAPGKEPVSSHTQFGSYAEFIGTNVFLDPDLANMPAVQKGMRSRGFKGLRTNPKQEVTVSNLHRILHEYIDGKR